MNNAIEVEHKKAETLAAELIADGYIRTSTKYRHLTKLPPDKTSGGTHITVDEATFEAFKKLGGHSLSEHMAIPGLHSDIERITKLLVRHGLPIRILTNKELKDMPFKRITNIRMWLEWPETVEMPEELKLCS